MFLNVKSQFLCVGLKWKMKNHISHIVTTSFFLSNPYSKKRYLNVKKSIFICRI